MSFTVDQRRKQIDDALRLLGSAQPRAGLEARVRARLAAEKQAAPRLRVMQRAGLGLAAVAAGAVIVAGSLWHGARNSSPAAAGIALPARGNFGAASAARIPAAPVAIAPGVAGRGRHRRSASTGRARLAAPPKRMAGVAAPDPATVKP